MSYLFKRFLCSLQYDFGLPCELRVRSVVRATVVDQQLNVAQEVCATVVLVSCNNLYCLILIPN